MFFVCICGAENLAKLFSLMDQNSPERVAFVSRALKWSTGGSGKLGHPKLHQLLAVTLWKGNQHSSDTHSHTHKTHTELKFQKLLPINLISWTFWNSICNAIVILIFHTDTPHCCPDVALLTLIFLKPSEQNYSESRYHFLHSSDGEGCAHMLVEYSASRGFRSEVDMFVAQAVLQ